MGNRNFMEIVINLKPMKTTIIEWTDKTWNFITGCNKHTAGCVTAMEYGFLAVGKVIGIYGQ